MAEKVDNMLGLKEGIFESSLNDLVGVQPMTAPTGKTFKMKMNDDISKFREIYDFVLGEMNTKELRSQCEKLFGVICNDEMNTFDIINNNQLIYVHKGRTFIIGEVE